MRVAEEKEAIAGLSIWALICCFDFGAVWPELDVASARWSGAGALAVFVASAVLLIVQCLQPPPRDLPRSLLKRPLSLAAHTVLVSGCGAWLIVQVAIGGNTPQVCAGAVALWALLSLSVVRACSLQSEQAPFVKSVNDCNTGAVPHHTKDDLNSETAMVVPCLSKDSAKEIVRPAERTEPLPPTAAPVPMPTAGFEDNQRPKMRKSKTLGASLKDLFSGPWQFKDSGDCPADDERASIITRVKKGSQRSGFDSEADTTIASTLDTKTTISQAEAPIALTSAPEDTPVECIDLPSTTVLHICELTEYDDEDAVLHKPKQGIGASPVQPAVRRISLTIPGARKSISTIPTVKPPPLLHLPGSRSQSPAQNSAAEEPAKPSATTDTQSPQASSVESPERESFKAKNTVDEPTGLKTPDEKELLEQRAAEGLSNEDTPIEAEPLRKAVLTNLCRRPPKIGDPISGARIEEIHDALFRDGDAAWLNSVGINESAYASAGDPEDLDKRDGSDDLEGPSDFKITDNMGNDDFQRLRDHFQAVEAGIPSANQSASMWPLLLNSFCGSRNSRRGDFLPGLSGQASALGSRTASAVGSRRASRRPSRIFQGVKDISNSEYRLASAQGSRIGSRSNSFCIPDANDTAKDATTASAATTRRESTAKLAPTYQRNSLALPLGAQLVDDKDDDDEDDSPEACEAAPTRSSRFSVSSVLPLPGASDNGSGLTLGLKTGAISRNNARRGTAPTLTMSVPTAVIPVPKTALYKQKTSPSLTIAEEKEHRGSISSNGSSICDEQTTPQGEKKADINPWMAFVCSCGNVFKDDSVYCRKCGKKRPVEEATGEDKKATGEEKVATSETPGVQKEEDVQSNESHHSDWLVGEDQDKDSEKNDEQEGDSKAVDDDGAEKLRTVLISQPQMKLKDLLLGEEGFGDLSAEYLLRVAKDWARADNQGKKGIEEIDTEGNSDESDDSDSFDDDEGFHGGLDLDFAGHLQDLKMDPATVSEALKMLMLLNDGFKAKHCTCKEGGPHTCMSPAVSQLASQVHSTLQSLNHSIAASKTVSVQGSRRASVEHGVVGRRRSSKENRKSITIAEGPTTSDSKHTRSSIHRNRASLEIPTIAEIPQNEASQETRSQRQETRSSVISVSVTEVEPPPKPTVGRSSLFGSRGHRLTRGKVDFNTGDTSFGPADVGAGPSSSSPTEQVDT